MLQQMYQKETDLKKASPDGLPLQLKSRLTKVDP